MGVPIVLNQQGRVNTPPATLLAQLIAAVAAENPGYTATLPGSLIEDVSSTDVGALVICDQAVTELINSLTPYGANAFLLNQLGQIYGVQLGGTTNTSVFVVFSGTPGFVIAQGVTVSDGTYQYTVQDGGIIASDGSSAQLFCLATVSGSWAVPAGSVTQVITSIPAGITLTVTNPSAGIPSAGAQTEEAYRAQVLQAGLATAQGFPTLLKTLLQNVSGVQARLIAVQQQVGGGWKIIVGGGDPYQVAYAIFTALFDVSTLVGSSTFISGITNANPGVAATTINHGFTTGQNNVHISGVVGMTGVNGGPYTVTVVDETHFSFGVNTTSSGSYVSGGVATPNTRNITVDINDYPDIYGIVFVNPPQQSVAISLTWNTISTNLVSASVVAQLGQPALVAYVNSVPVGQPMNLFELQATFQSAIAEVIPPALLTRMVFSVSINSVGVSPEAGTGIIAGDSESFFLTTTGQVTITQG